MPKNPYFDHHDQANEQRLLDSLVKEAIEINGIDLYYLPRTTIALSDIYGEDTESEFNSCHLIVGWIQSTAGFEGQGDILSQFGFSIGERLTIVISRTEFNDVMCNKNIDRPTEGDLLYFPKSQGIFRISFVEHDQPFYTLGNTYSYKITLDLFSYSHEVFNTGNDEIDRIAQLYEQQINITLGSGTGTFLKDEIAYQGSNLGSATGSCSIISHTTGLVIAKRAKGKLDIVNGNLKGNTSEASFAITAIAYNPSAIVESDNIVIEEAALEHINFDELNPFGRY